MAPRASAPTVSDRRADFHSHSYLTDGETSATDMWVEAEAIEHRALALTDHLGTEDPKPMLDHLLGEAKAWEGSRFVPIVGVELTKIPPPHIGKVARAARKAGAEIVIVHGETTSGEFVLPGTNHAAIDSGEVDVLAHPGLIDPKDVALAKAHAVVLEISGRTGHSLTNGHVARLALELGADLVVDSDAHAPEQLIPLARAVRVALGAGVPERTLERVLVQTPNELLRRTHGR